MTNCKYCIDDLNFMVKVVDIETKCKYHKKMGAVYLPASVAPSHLCRELFYAAYPGSLAVLYSGRPLRGWLRKKGRTRITARCPAASGVRVEIRAEEKLIPPVRAIKELTEELCKIVFRPVDGPFRRIIIEVIETSTNCPKGYHIGDTFHFNINKQDELCPAGFATLYPYLRLMEDMKRDNSPSTSIKVHCPDCVGVTYELAINDDKDPIK